MTDQRPATIEIDIGALNEVINAAKGVTDLKAFIPEELKNLKAAVGDLKEALNQYKAAEGRRPDPAVAGTVDDRLRQG